MIEQNKIPYTILANNAKMPMIGMGTFGSDRFNAEEVSNAVYGAIKCGYRMFDGASVYGNEAQIGDVFARAIAEGIVKREDLFVTSKVWNDMHGRGDVLISCAQTLKDLRLDSIDLYFIHWPFPNFHPPKCDVSSRSKDAVPFSVERFMATWRQMERLVDMGLVKSIGMSNMTVKKMEQVLPLCRIKPVALEMEHHPSFQQPELFDFCKANNIQPIGFCPIGSPERPDRDKTPDDVADIEMPEIVAAAKAHNVHPAIICLKWAFQRGVAPIPFAVVEDFYKGNLKCVTEDLLTDAEMASIKSVNKNCRLIKGHVFLWEDAVDWNDLWD